MTARRPRRYRVTPPPLPPRTDKQVLAAADAAIAAAKAKKAREQAVQDALRKTRVEAALAKAPKPGGSGTPSRTMPAVLPPNLTEAEKARLLAGVNRHPELANAKGVTWVGPGQLLVEGQVPGPLDDGPTRRLERRSYEGEAMSRTEMLAMLKSNGVTDETAFDIISIYFTDATVASLPQARQGTVSMELSRLSGVLPPLPKRAAVPTLQETVRGRYWVGPDGDLRPVGPS